MNLYIVCATSAGSNVVVQTLAPRLSTVSAANNKLSRGVGYPAYLTALRAALAASPDPYNMVGESRLAAETAGANKRKAVGD